MKQTAMILLENPAGELLVCKRSPDKKIYPSLHALGAGGGVEKGETAEQAAYRELKEELGIHTKLTFLFAFHYTDEVQGHVMHVYHGIYAGNDLVPNHEFSWIRWMTKEDIDNIVARETMCPDTKIAYERWKSL